MRRIRLTWNDLFDDYKGLPISPLESTWLLFPNQFYD